MYKLTQITQFEAQQMLEVLNATNDGSGSRSDIRSFLKLTDKLEDGGNRKVLAAVYDQAAFIKMLKEKYSEEKLRELNNKDVDQERLEIWDQIFAPELLFEDEEFKMVKEAFEELDRKKKIPRIREQARRIICFMEKLEQAESFDAKDLIQKPNQI